MPPTLNLPFTNLPPPLLADSVSLKFIGDWSTPTVFISALALATLMFFYYRRELRFHSPAPRLILPSLRSLTVFLIVLCLAGPTLRHEKTVRQLNRILILADASASMSFTDAPAPTTNPTSPTQTSRFNRLQQALLHPPHQLIHTLIQNRLQNIELFALRNHKADRIWWHRDNGKDSSGELPSQIAKPDSPLTNLNQPLRDALGASLSNTAIILLSDGQHNGPGSPESLAQQLAPLHTPIFTIGYGQEIPPHDLSLAQITAPEAVYPDGRTEGILHINDHLPPGLTAIASISASDNSTLWEHKFTTEGSGSRNIPFSFPVSTLAKINSNPKETLRHLNVRVELTGDPQTVSKDLLPQNNQSPLAIHLLSQKRKVLLLDGRPRWETRYLFSHFDRDARWQIVSAFDDFTNSSYSSIQRAFPKDEKEMQTYDLVIIGDLRPDALPPERHQLLQLFVEKHGGGLIFLDGQRGHLQAWRNTSNQALIPVSWKPNTNQLPLTHELTNNGQSLPALNLSDSPSTNQSLWKQLPNVHWAANAEPLPDATTLAHLTSSSTTLPAMVWRRYGAGSVLWLATDEYWRWRYEVADLHHQRFWMQLAAWIAAPPFIAQDDRLSLDIDRLRYRENDKAEIRIRLRDASGNIITSHPDPTSLRAHLSHNNQPFATLQLEPDPAHGGVFRAISGSLPSGDFSLSVTQNNNAVSDLNLQFQVTDNVSLEWANLTLNRPLLESISRTSGGRFLRESDISQLPELLRQSDQPQVLIQEKLLWSSWWWFIPIILLLTSEWLLRKHWRLV